jgi:hypothetical protein
MAQSRKRKRDDSDDDEDPPHAKMLRRTQVRESHACGAAES